MSLYRCAECGHGRRLYAYSQAVAWGRLHEDGLLAEHLTSDDCFVFESSIECAVHIDALIEKKIDGRFRRFVICPTCGGDGKKGYYGRCETCSGTGRGWYVQTQNRETVVA